MSWSVLLVFVPVFFMVSITPGLCMTLALALGISLGLRRTLWMMLGELVGVGLSAVVTLVGVAEFMHNYPKVFELFKYGGGLYLLYLAWQLWHARGSLALQASANNVHAASKMQLITQGLVTAIANPKGWAFFIALLPPFVDSSQALLPQMSLLLAIILLLEFICLLIYAGCGSALQSFFNQPHHTKRLNRIAGGLLGVVAVWLMVA